MKKLIQKITHPIYKKYHFWYHRKARKYNYKNIYTIVQPTVFSPIHTVSTKIFLDYISSLPLANSTILELGCGSGIISLQCAYLGAKVTASDINQVALDSLDKVAKEQGLKIDTQLSDVLDDLYPDKFGFIFVNPPFFPKKPSNTAEKAWFCGENFEFFEKMLSQLKNIDLHKTQVLMILSDGCDVQRITQIAEQHHLKITTKETIELTFETNFIYQIQNQE